MNFLSPSILYVLYIFEVGEINLHVSYRDDICLRFDNEGLSTIFYCTLSYISIDLQYIFSYREYFIGNFYFPGIFLE
jgi:hypothetical protein